MTDNGSSFCSHRYAKALRRLRIKHLRTKPYTPRTNGKAERFVQTSLANGPTPGRTAPLEHRAAELPHLAFTATTGIAPMAASEPNLQSARIALTEDNVLRLHTRPPPRSDRHSPPVAGRRADLAFARGLRRPWET